MHTPLLVSRTRREEGEQRQQQQQEQEREGEEEQQVLLPRARQPAWGEEGEEEGEWLRREEEGEERGVPLPLLRRRERQGQG